LQKKLNIEISLIEEKIAPYLEEAEKTQIPEAELEKIEQEGEPSAPIGAIDETLPDFTKLLLSLSIASIRSGGPLCIIVPKSEEKYEDLVSILCREVYREKVGGKPEPIIAGSIDELEYLFQPAVENQIVILELKDSKDKINHYLINKLRGFFSLNSGFLILVSEEKNLELNLKEEIPDIENKLVTLEPRKLSDLSKNRIFNIISGFKRTPQKEGGMIISYPLGSEFKKASEEFDGVIIRKYLNEYYRRAPEELKCVWNKLTASSATDEEEASDLHSALKAFIWSIKWEEGKRAIELEDEKKECDVRVGDEFYEVETFFGSGDFVSKLTEKMEKYTDGEKVYFVLRNLSIFLHLPELLIFKSTWQKKKKVGKLEIFGLDIKNEKLVPIEEFQKEFKEIESELRTKG
jgi:hypothetical protein